MMPEYGLGYWQCKLRYYNQDEVLKIAKEHKERNIPLVLADRSIQTTFTRIWRTSTFWDKIKLLSVIISSIFATTFFISCCILRISQI